MDKHIVAIGGLNPVNSFHQDSVDIYNVTKDEWQPAPSLILARWGHSSCSLGDFIYVAFGRDSENHMYNLFERLDMAKLTSGD